MALMRPPKLPPPAPCRTASVQSPLAAADAAAGRPTPTAAAAPLAPKQGATGTPVTAAGRRFVSYCVQKLSSGKANHAAFWIQDEAGESLLAVVVSQTFSLILPLISSSIRQAVVVSWRFVF